MNLLKIIDMLDLTKVDHEEYVKPAMRRDLFKKAKDFSLKAALTSAPFALAAMPSIVKAQSNSINDVLNFALTLEYLEAEFYTMGLASSNLIPTSDRNIFTKIQEHETAHVKFLEGALGTNKVMKPAFDFTVGGAFPTFTDYPTFLALAQAFEDTGVRAYKGQAGNLMTSDGTLTAALNIHSVEARHASVVRRLRTLKGWITGKERGMGMPEATQAVYDGEENVTQASVLLSTITTVTGSALSEAFDEPLTKDQVLAIAGLFLKK